MLWRIRYQIARAARFVAPDPQKTLQTYDRERLIDRVSGTTRRRIFDRIEDTFYQACLSGDHDTAEDLYALLLNMRERHVRTYGKEHRINNNALIKIERELARRKAAQTQVASGG